ncbi:hypothetical protein QUB80_08790 [Chlorogloeopsis sp. ULAP01]|uniref:hypothetical protein n=1 Tax=Chlorogloeopsis sp. ULAP01 TaxID=3056483 RepID=UPI0025AB132E|nr:hypothetical protein [Chlorogloeopsis sp. ULAP01]MDM9380799.1 hypothetical protein [Chlorogloeopsis sp. ULAP01]
MKIKGIKRGKTIEIFAEINIPDGQEIIIEIQEEQLLSEEERHKRMKELLATLWEDKENFVKTMEELEKEKNVSNGKSEFWKSLEKFRQEEDLEAAGIESEVFAEVRDYLPGGEVIW